MEYRNWKELWYVKKPNGSVINISTTEEDADYFLRNSLKNIGTIYYVKVPQEDYDSYKVDGSTINAYARDYWRPEIKIWD